MTRCEKDADLATLRYFVNLWRREEMAEYKKRISAGEIIQQRNVIGKKRELPTD